MVNRLEALGESIFISHLIKSHSIDYFHNFQFIKGQKDISTFLPIYLFSFPTVLLLSCFYNASFNVEIFIKDHLHIIFHHLVVLLLF